jgi:hypothetical protein
MKEKLKAALVSKGMPEATADKVINYVTVGNESEIEGIANELTSIKTTVSPTFNTVDELIKDPNIRKLVDSHADRRVTEAQATFLKNHGAKIENGKLIVSENQNSGTNPDLEEMKKTLNEIKNKERVIEVRNKVLEKIKSQNVKLPTAWHDKINITDEAQIDTVASNIIKEYSDVRQTIIDQDFGGVPPRAGVASDSSAKSVIDAWAAENKSK